LTVNELLAVYIKQHVDSYYRKNGEPTSEPGCIRIAVAALASLFGDLPAREFSPFHLKTVRDSMVRRDWVRTSINRHVGRIRRVFGWAASEGYIPGNVHASLAAVQGLRRGRGSVAESTPVAAVPLETVEATLPKLPRVVAAMVRLQLLAGCRPGEVCAIRPADVDRNSDPWCYRPRSHKTEHHDHERRIYFGPKAQAVLAPYLFRDGEAFCFVPRERTSERPERVDIPTTDRRVSDRYTAATYGKTIAQAIKRAKRDRKDGEPEIPHWGPNQLRHTRATELRKAYGLEAARVVLGHSRADVTQVTRKGTSTGRARSCER
jgi:integrase